MIPQDNLQQKRKFKVWLPFLLSICMVLGMFLGYKMRDSIPGKSFFYQEHRNPLQEIMQLIGDNYVDSVSIDVLTDTAIQAMLQKLDPHSVYIPAEELQQVNDELAGGFFGIGIEFNIIDDTIHVINVLKDGPAFGAGLQSGDKILKAGDSILSGKNRDSDKVRSLLKGKEGTAVLTTILRGNKQLKIEIIRGMIPLVSIDAAYLMEDGIGYIRLNKFSQQTYREFMENLDSLNKQGMKNLILDLRDNGGGILDEAVEIADEFLGGDKLITYTEGLHNKRKEYHCRRNGQFENGKLVVLTNEGTASASEILAGALQDWERAKIIGRRTFGKGLVQEQFDLSDHSALRLTIARYYTPLGRSIQRSYANGGKAYYEEVSNRFTDGEYFYEDSTKRDTTKKFHTNSGKLLFGGGGISPDIFVGGDTGRMGEYTARLLINGTLNNFGYRYLLTNPSFKGKYQSPEDFSKHFNISSPEWFYFDKITAEDTISGKPESQEERLYIANALKRSIARQIWRNEGYYKVLNTGDKAIIKALEWLKN